MTMHKEQKAELGFPAFDASKLEAPIRTLLASVGVGKSRMFRAKAAKTLNQTKHEGCVVIACDRHDLGAEQVNKFYEEHPGTALVARIWRGRNAIDPEYPQPEDSDAPKIRMCQRNADAEEVGKHGLSVEHHLCRYVDKDTDEETLCPHYSEDAPMPCGYQRQQRQHANLWFCAHETLLHEVPAIFGKVLMLFIDEDPLDAFLFGLDEQQYTLPLDELMREPRNIKDKDERKELTRARRELYKVLSSLRDGPVPVNALRAFYKEKTDRMLRLEWQNKVADVDIRPDMGSTTIRSMLTLVAVNKTIKVRALLWKMLGEAGDKPIIVDGVEVWPYPGQHEELDTISGRLEIIRDKKRGRMIRMKGIQQISGGCRNVMTTIGSATLDHELLLPIFPTAKAYPPLTVPKPPHVVTKQVIDRSFSKKWMIPDDNEQAMVQRAQDIYAMILREASKFAPLRSLVVVHLATKLAILEHCFVPEWIELAHHGAVTGIDKWKTVRAAFIVGRPMPPAYELVLQAEALSGEHISDREYVEVEVPIQIVPDQDGNNVVYVKQLQHRHPMVERLRKRVVEGGVIQAAGRTRYVERTADTPLELWLFNNVPMAELAPVEAIEAAEIAPGLDDLMWTTGIWLENAADAARAFPTLIASKAALDMDRSRRRTLTFSCNKVSYREMLATSSISYRRVGKGTKNAMAVFLPGSVPDREAWLDDKLGPLAHFSIEGKGEGETQRAEEGALHSIMHYKNLSREDRAKLTARDYN